MHNVWMNSYNSFSSYLLDIALDSFYDFFSFREGSFDTVEDAG